jgi:hypothetical protein
MGASAVAFWGGQAAEWAVKRKRIGDGVLGGAGAGPHTATYAQIGPAPAPPRTLRAWVEH